MVNGSIGAHAIVADTTAVLGREVTANIIVCNFVAFGTRENTHRASQVRTTVGEDAIIRNSHEIILAVIKYAG